MEQYQLLFDAQNGRCAICNTDTPGGRYKTFHIDHCHETGKVRGLLCSRCNMHLGGFNDDPVLISKALNYLLEER